jgi:hypothetical protein
MLAISHSSWPPHHELFPLFFVSMNKNKIRKNNLKLEFHLLRIDCIVLLYYYITRLQILILHPVTMSNDEDIFDDFDYWNQNRITKRLHFNYTKIIKIFSIYDYFILKNRVHSEFIRMNSRAEFMLRRAKWTFFSEKFMFWRGGRVQSSAKTWTHASSCAGAWWSN